MLQYPAFMTQYPWSTRMIPTSFLLPAQWPQPPSDELLLAMEESDFEDKVIYDKPNSNSLCHKLILQLRALNEIRKTNSNLIVIGKTSVENDKEDYDNDADDEEADNADESEGDDFEQETG
ncbi:hypothetical protein C3L33_14379, partial [Rhododendron williamsianum]